MGPYWDVSWSPRVGCSHKSAGCSSCWAETLASTRLAHLPEYKELTRNRRWTGEIRDVPERLSEPEHWRKPRVIFTCIMGDMFFESASHRFTRAIFETMRRNQQHTFLTCTKRPQSTLDYIAWENESAIPFEPPPNWWAGVTAENQAMADERIPLLLATPATHRWVSVEPQLSLILRSWRGIDQVVVGAESGRGMRPCDAAWVRSIAKECKAQSVPCFVKQLHIDGKCVSDPTLFPFDLLARELAWRKP